MRILNGISPVSLQSTRDLTNEFNELGYLAESVVYRSNPLLNKLEDKNLNIDLKKYYLYPVYFIKVLFFFVSSLYKYDVFHFHFGHTLLPFNLDVPILKLFRKKVFMEYHGSDIRYKLNKIQSDKIVHTEDEFLKKKSIRRQKRIYKFLDAIFLHDNELINNLYDPLNKLHMLPLRIDLDRLKYDKIQSNNRVTIVHAPSKRAIKGSEYIESAINELKKDFDIDYLMINNMNYNQAISIYRKADIIIDQMIIGTYGMLSVEGMALGKCVVCYIEDGNLFDDSNPICNTSITGLKDSLARLIENEETRNEYSESGMKYVQKYHNSKKVARLALEYYKQNKEV